MTKMRHRISPMKKLILTVMAAGFVVAVQAGTDKASTPSCCAQMTSRAKAQCPMMTSDAKAQCPMMSKDTKGCCPMMGAKASKTACTKPVLKSPKALG